MLFVRIQKDWLTLSGCCCMQQPQQQCVLLRNEEVESKQSETPKNKLLPATLGTRKDGAMMEVGRVEPGRLLIITDDGKVMRH